jgi:serine protease AprX
MHKLIWITLFLITTATVKAADPVMVWVQFKDKNHSGYSINRPHEFLSVKALERRRKMQIPVDNFDLPVSRIYVDSISSDAEYSLMYTSRWFNGALFKAASEDAVNRLKSYGFVSSIEITKPATTKNTGKSSMQVMDNEYTTSYSGISPFSVPVVRNPFNGYGASEVQINMIKGKSLHSEGFWGEGITIAVLDGGFRSVDTMRAFDHLWSSGRILGYYDFVELNNELFQGHAHGTYVLSVMAGHLPGEYLGVAPMASYWLLRTEDAATEYRIEEYNWLAGAEFADSVGADIINSSLGYTMFDDPRQNYTYTDLDGATTVVSRAANLAYTRGMLVVNSAGNYGAAPWRYIGAPADGHGVLAVGGTDNNGIIARFSSRGPTPDGRIKPQVVAQGQTVAIVNYMGQVSTANGTSFSAPLIAGMAACLWQRYPDASNVHIKQAIIKSADRYLKPDSLYGYGMANFQKAVTILEKQIDESIFLKLIHNPLIAESAITFYNLTQETITIEMFNSSGQKVWSRADIVVVPGYNELRPFSDISSLTSGMYLIRVNFKDRSQLLKTIKL